MKNKLLRFFAALAFLADLSQTSAQTTNVPTFFSYQGDLNFGGSPANGVYDWVVKCVLGAIGPGGVPVETNYLASVTNLGVPVSNGLFTMTLDFGSNFFNGSAAWLELSVATNGSTNFTTLSPLQPLTPTPQSLYALNAGMASNLSGALPSTQLQGVYGNAVTLNNPSNNLAGIGASLTSLNASSLTSGTVPLAQLPASVLTSTTSNATLPSLTLNGVLNLPSPAIIYAGSNFTLIDEGSFFAGGAGNRTLTGASDVGVGKSALLSVTSGSYNTAIGEQTLEVNLTGSNNTANGFDALSMNSAGSGNTAMGYTALADNSNGLFNTAMGMAALGQLGGSFLRLSGTNNIALGYQAGYNLLQSESSNIDIGNPGAQGDNNIIRIGVEGTQTNTFVAGIYGATPTNPVPVYVNAAGQLGTTGTLPSPSFTGTYSNVVNLSNTLNTFTGNGGGLTGLDASQLSSGTVPLAQLPASVLTSSSSNATLPSLTLNGVLNLPSPAIIYAGSNYTLIDEGSFFAGGAGNRSLTGVSDVGVGQAALRSVTDGSYNTAIGEQTLVSNTIGSNNTSLGYGSLFINGTGNYNTADGVGALQNNTSGDNNIALGYWAGYNVDTGSTNIDIGNFGLPGDNNTIRIGETQTNAFMAGIYGVNPPEALPVVVNASGQLGTATTLPASAFSGTDSNVLTLNNPNNIFTGNGAGLTSLNASNITSGTLPLAQLPASVLTTSTSNAALPSLTLGGALNLPSPAIIYAGSNYTLIDEGSLFLGGAGNLLLTGVSDVGIGKNALRFVTSGSYNTAIGEQALQLNTTGSNNVASGFQALYGNMSGSYNTATGVQALQLNFFGSNNTASGFQALYDNIYGSGNTAAGVNALYDNSNGYFNTAIGMEALGKLGSTSLLHASGSNNIALGYQAGVNLLQTESSNIDIGNPGTQGDNDIIRIGVEGTQTNTFVAGIYGADPSNAIPVFINSAGQLGTMGTVPLGFFAGTDSNTVTFNNSNNIFTGNGGGLTGLDASQLTSGTVPLAQLPASVLTSSSSNATLFSLTLNGALNLPFPAAINSGSNSFITEEGSLFMGLNAGAGALPGSSQTGFGDYVLSSGSTGIWNTGMGEKALSANTTGAVNTADGYYALAFNTGGSDNTAVGGAALNDNNNGSGNTAIGGDALLNSDADDNTAIGGAALLQDTSGTNNIALGFGAGMNLTTGNNNIEIGNGGTLGESGTIRIGTNLQTAAFIAGIYGVTAPDATPVFINGAGQLGTVGVLPASGLSGAYTNPVFLNNPNNLFIGSGAGLSNLNASQLSSGVIPLAQLPASVLTSSSSNATLPGLTLNGALNLPSPAIIYAGSNFTFIDEGSFFAGGAGNISLTGVSDVGVGKNALLSVTSGSYNTAIGEQALQFNTTGFNNTASGFGSLFLNTTGSNNTAGGFQALFMNTNGIANTANGFQALWSNSIGSYNTAIGEQALYLNMTGSNNTASGFASLFANTLGTNNTADGFEALDRNSTGDENTASGAMSLFANTTGSGNTASGDAALVYNSSGSYNTANGLSALLFNTTGYFNTAVGGLALFANTTGSGNMALGYQAGYNLTSGSDNIYIGNQGGVAESGIIRIGTNVQTNTFIAGIYGVNPPNAIPVFINSAGQLGTTGTVPSASLSGTYTNALTFNNVCNSISGTLAGNGGGLSNLNASQLTSGTVPLAQLPASVLTSSSSNATLPSLTLNGALNLPFPATINSGSNTLLVEEGSLFLGLHAGAGAGPGTSQTGFGDNVLSSGSTGSFNTGTGENALHNNTIGVGNTANGSFALALNSSGFDNTALGAFALQTNTYGGSNTAIGPYALYTHSTGDGNTAIGPYALFNNFIGNINTAVGLGALQSCNGNDNIALGVNAGFNFTGSESGNIDIVNYGVTGDNDIIRIGVEGTQTNTYVAGIYGADPTNAIPVFINSAGQLGTVGTLSLSDFGGTDTNAVTLANAGNSFTGNGGGLTDLNASQLISVGNGNSGLPHQLKSAGNFFVGPAGNPSTSGSWNTALGTNALVTNTSGSQNTAVGAYALANNAGAGGFNTSVGAFALEENTTGYANTATGDFALGANTTGSNSTAIGANALGACLFGNNNIALGSGAGGSFNSNESGNIDIGSSGVAGDAGAIRIGSNQNATYLAGIYGANPSSNGVPVFINSAGQLGTVGSLSLSAFAGMDNNTVSLNNPSNSFSGSFLGNGSGLTGLNACNIISGTLPLAQLPTSVLTSSSSNATLPSLTLNGVLNLPSPAIIYAGSNYTLIDEGSFFAGGAGNRSLTGVSDVGVGQAALRSVTDGSYNTAIGEQTLVSNTIGSNNTSLGYGSLFINGTGNYNTADGVGALQNNTSGDNNIALGYWAGYNVDTGSTNIDIGNFGLPGDNNTIRIGEGQTNAFMAGIYGVNPPEALPVVVNASGQLGTATTLPASAFSGTDSNVLTLNNPNNIFTGNGAGLTSLNASNITSGTLPLAQLPASVLTTSTSNAALPSLTLGGALNLPSPAIIYAGSNYTLIDEGSLFLGGAGNLLLTGVSDVGIGRNALRFVTSGAYNTAIGEQALQLNTTGSNNTASGFGSLFMNTAGSSNTANGFQALWSNTIGSYNTAVGEQALYLNETGSNNTASGFESLFANTIGTNNTADGFEALYRNSTGDENTASGAMSLFANTTGSGNTASGDAALVFNSSGSYNTANGLSALLFNTTGYFNTAVGGLALFANTTGSGNMALGYQAGYNLTSGSDNIYIGNQGGVAESGIIRIGTNVQTNTFIAGISGATISGGAAVYVDPSTGQLGVETSSARFKTDIQSMGEASDVLLALKPVTFKYKPGIDPSGKPQFGLIAEQVEEVDPDLVVHDKDHGIYTVRYEAVNAMLLNEFLTEHRQVENQHAEIEKLKEKADKVDSLEKQLNELKQMVQLLAEKK